MRVSPWAGNSEAIVLDLVKNRKVEAVLTCYAWEEDRPWLETALGKALPAGVASNMSGARF